MFVDKELISVHEVELPYEETDLECALGIYAEACAAQHRIIELDAEFGGKR